MYSVLMSMANSLYVLLVIHGAVMFQLMLGNSNINANKLSKSQCREVTVTSTVIANHVFI